jgi:predicted nucleic acid-binding Zn ribbon protein
LFGTGAAVVFKGSGFYQTDYRSESYMKGAKADKESASKASGSKDKTKKPKKGKDGDK